MIINTLLPTIAEFAPSTLNRKGLRANKPRRERLSFEVTRSGLEPETPTLKVLCSTN